jgi:hypothetical protein
VRAEHDLKLEFGDIFHDTAGENWVFVGWMNNTVGKEAMFVKELTGRAQVWDYHASMTETLIRKFPDLKRKRICAAS